MTTLQQRLILEVEAHPILYSMDSTRSDIRLEGSKVWVKIAQKLQFENVFEARRLWLNLTKQYKRYLLGFGGFDNADMMTFMQPHLFVHSLENKNLPDSTYDEIQSALESISPRKVKVEPSENTEKRFATITRTHEKDLDLEDIEVKPKKIKLNGNRQMEQIKEASNYCADNIIKFPPNTSPKMENNITSIIQQQPLLRLNICQSEACENNSAEDQEQHNEEEKKSLVFAPQSKNECGGPAALKTAIDMFREYCSKFDNNGPEFQDLMQHFDKFSKNIIEINNRTLLEAQKASNTVKESSPTLDHFCSTELTFLGYAKIISNLSFPSQFRYRRQISKIMEVAEMETYQASQGNNFPNTLLN